MPFVSVSFQVRRSALATLIDEFVEELGASPPPEMLAVMERIKGIVTEEPPPYAGTPPHIWLSQAQRRRVMWEIATGALQFPYQRTGAYVGSWQIERIRGGYKLSSSHPDAMLMAGLPGRPEKQFYLHRGRWNTLDAAVNRGINMFAGEIDEGVYNVARRRGLMV